MKTPICFNNKGNEVIAWCLLSVWSCLLLSGQHHYMWCCCQCSLQHICANWVSNDNIHQGLEAIPNDKYIHLLSGATREKVDDLLLNMCSTFQNNNYDSILKCIVGYYMFTLERAPKQMGTWIVNGMTTLTLWKMGYCRMWQAKMSM
jgi:hypothetical protein